MILFFVKAPRKGQVKSRLAQRLGEDNALALYRSFVSDMLETVDSAGVPSSIFFHPSDAGTLVREWLGASRSFRAQQGTDLGERMNHAFCSSFSEGCDRAVLIGSDIPDLPPAIVTEAIEALGSKDAVIGPARDGGYYLIGFRREGFAPEVFSGISWSRPDVFRRTMHTFALKGTTVHVLPLWQDVDTVDDVLSLLERNSRGAFAHSRTMNCIRSMKHRLPGSEDLHGTL